MRVTLHLVDSAPDHLAGTLTCATRDRPVAFDGWLDLMRLLEAVTADAPSRHTDGSQSSDESTRPAL